MKNNNALRFCLLASCTSVQNTTPSEPFTWEGANLYFLVTDRFNNGNLKMMSISIEPKKQPFFVVSKVEIYEVLSKNR
jgi:hypothetical protein